MTGTQLLLLAAVGLWVAESGGLFSHRAERRSGRAVPKTARKLARRAEAQGDTGLAERLKAGEIRGEELRDLMASGQLSTRRNPAPIPRGMSAADRRVLARAEQMAQEFHGEEDGHRQVIELSERERKLPRFVVALGEMPTVDYQPNRGSKRAQYEWTHQSGDAGPFAPRGESKPVLAADPDTRRPLIVPMRSGMRWDPDRGLVG